MTERAVGIGRSVCKALGADTVFQCFTEPRPTSVPPQNSIFVILILQMAMLSVLTQSCNACGQADTDKWPTISDGANDVATDCTVLRNSVRLGFWS